MTYQKKRRQKCSGLEKLIFFIIVAANLILCIDFIRFPECYLTTWKYQLKNEIAVGNQEMIDYYNRVYVENNRSLFD